MSNNKQLLMEVVSPRLEQAKLAFQQAVAHIKTQQYGEAEILLKRVVKIIPKHANSYQLISFIKNEQGEFEQALKALNRAIAHDTPKPEYYFNRAMIYMKLNKHALAIADLKQALAIDRTYYPAYCAMGDVLQLQQQFSKAIKYYELALKLVNTDEKLWNNIGFTYNSLKQYQHAIRCFKISLQLNPNNTKTHVMLGNLYKKQANLELAQQAYQAAFKLNPHDTNILAALLLCNNMICHWDNREEFFTLLRKELAHTANLDFDNRFNSFASMSLPYTNAELLQMAKLQSNNVIEKIAPLAHQLKFKHRPHHKPRLRIGYISSSFRNYPTGHLTQDLYANHNRERFEVFAYSYGKDDGSIYRQKIAQGCDHFIDITQLSTEQACQRIYADNIDILIDLMGHTTGARLEINALRPAPLNVRYLGSPGTTGASFFDYMIADNYITPPEYYQDYTEHLVLMPHCYQINPLQLEIAHTLPTRTECGLPETSIVFCAFNNGYKIEPVIFTVWMNILKAVPHSVLWLQTTGLTHTNLVNAAAQHGISSDRIISATRLPKDQHLARHAHADLFLDTHYYNAHTTASDALWMNVPVLTCPGSTFHSRVAASLLQTLGMEELIMPDLATYQSYAIKLATSPQLLQQVKQKLTSHGTSSPLFDTKRFIHNLEKAYLMMWDNYLNNKKSVIKVQE